MMALSLAGNALLARLLTPSDMGAYFYAASLAIFFAAVAQLGLGRIATKTIAENLAVGDAGGARQSAKAILRLGALAALGLVVIASAASGMLGLSLVFVLLVPLWIFVESAQRLIAEVLRGFDDIRAATLFGGLVAAGVFVGLLWIVSLTPSPLDQIHAVELKISSIAFSTILALVVLWRMFNTQVVSASINTRLSSPSLLRQSAPILITNLTWLTMAQSDIWIVAAFRHPSEVAVYGAAARLAILVSVPLDIVNAVIAPSIARLYKLGRKNELEKMLRDSATLASIASIASLILYMSLGADILEFVYGSVYRDGAMVLALTSLGQIVNVWSGSCGLALMMTDHQRALMLISVLRSVLTVSAALALVQPLGIVGVAGVMALGVALQNIWTLGYVKHAVGIWTHARMWIR